MSAQLKIERAIASVNPVAYVPADLEGLPESLHEGYARWWCFGIAAGSFLQAVIENNLYRAAIKADDLNVLRLREISLWFWTNADSRAIGANAKAWGDAGGHFGRMAEAEGEGVTSGL